MKQHHSDLPSAEKAVTSSFAGKGPIQANGSAPNGMPVKLRELIERFCSKKLEEWEEAAKELRRMGASALPALSWILRQKEDKDARGKASAITWMAKERAAKLLGAIGSVSAVPSLLEASRDGNEWVRVAALEAISKIAGKNPDYCWKDAVNTLQESMQDQNEMVRGWAAMALGRTSDASAAGLLIRALSDPSKFVRKQASEGLARIGLPALPAVMAALNDANNDVLMGAGVLLEKLAEDHPAEVSEGIKRFMGTMQEEDSGEAKRLMLESILEKTLMRCSRRMFLRPGMPPNGQNH